MDIGPPPLGGDQDQAGKFIITSAVLTSISVAIVALRFNARAVRGNRFGWDDWTMLVTLVRSLSTNGLALSQSTEKMTVSSYSKFWNRCVRGTCWLWTACLLLGPCTSHSSWERSLRYRDLVSFDYLYGKGICGIVSTKNRGFTKVA